MGERDVEEQIARLEERLARIEARLGIPIAPPTIATPEPTATAIPKHVPPVQFAIPIHAEPAAPAPPPFLKAQAAKPRASGAGAFETQVGLKWAAWAGAIIVVIGAALGIKFAYDQHWFEAIGPALRVALMSLGGFALLAAGEAVYRRVGALAAAGLFAAGVATLFVVSY